MNGKRGENHIDFFIGLLIVTGLSLPLWALILYPFFV